LIAAPTDEEAELLATSVYQRVLGILTGDRRRLQPPMADFWARVPPNARSAIDDFLAVAVVGGPAKVRQGLTMLTEATQADEFMFVCDVYEPELRWRALDIAVGAMRA
jgi:alkanesulfonate monooxygenase SsuD/methylene tetrahydromethanopterin reductase-like flavin-dependent oxidoreductase (luciferase family)